MERYRRIFIIVLDSLGVGAMPDSPNFGDVGVNTLEHISQSVDALQIPNLQRLGLANLCPLKQVAPADLPLAYYTKLNERSNGKDTMTGHWEIMGLEQRSWKNWQRKKSPPDT